MAIIAAVLGVLVLLQIVGRAHRLPRPPPPLGLGVRGLRAREGCWGTWASGLLHWGVTDYLSFRYGDFWLPPGNVADIALFLSIPLAIPVIVFELMGRARRGRGPVRPMHPRGAEPNAA